jgi:hypothetical protein
MLAVEHTTLIALSIQLLQALPKDAQSAKHMQNKKPYEASRLLAHEDSVLQQFFQCLIHHLLR